METGRNSIDGEKIAALVNFSKPVSGDLASQIWVFDDIDIRKDAIEELVLLKVMFLKID